MGVLNNSSIDNAVVFHSCNGSIIGDLELKLSYVGIKGKKGIKLVSANTT